MAAVTALKSFSEAIPLSSSPNLHHHHHHHHLPWLLALYDALNDDDDEIRDAAASAAAPVLSGQQLEPAEAARRLLGWLRGQRYGGSPSLEFRVHAAGRMIGHVSSVPLPSSSSSSSSSLPIATAAADGGNDENKEEKTNPTCWTSAEHQLRAAMRFDDSLFVVEEQNLYVDEVREARRWRDVLFAASSSSSPSPSPTAVAAEAPSLLPQPQQQQRPELEALETWTLDGLRSLIRLTETTETDGGGGDDGPLGWTSKPEVFAICARILVAGTALASSSLSSSGEIRDALRAFQEAGRRARVHGLLLGMCVYNS